MKEYLKLGAICILALIAVAVVLGLTVILSIFGTAIGIALFVIVLLWFAFDLIRMWAAAPRRTKPKQ